MEDIEEIKEKEAAETKPVNRGGYQLFLQTLVEPPPPANPSRLNSRKSPVPPLLPFPDFFLFSPTTGPNTPAQIALSCTRRFTPRGLYDIQRFLLLRSFPLRRIFNFHPSLSGGISFPCRTVHTSPFIIKLLKMISLHPPLHCKLAGLLGKFPRFHNHIFRPI